MLFFPLRTDRPQHHTPWVNYALIAANVLVYLGTFRQVEGAARMMQPGSVPIEEVIARFPVIGYYLFPGSSQLLQFITYQFLHANLAHLAGNMLFLYVFGNSMEDRLGKAGYLGFYLAGGVLAGVGHVLSSSAPVLGASGAVAAVTGAYLALFPLSYVTIVYWFFFIGVFEVASLYVIGLQIAINIFFQVSDFGASVAYMAHLAGYAYGFALGMLLLFTRLLPREPFDMLALWERRRRRAKFRALTREGYRPWEAEAALAEPGKRKGKTDPQRDAKLIELRGQIAEAMAKHDPGAAADLYSQLLQVDANQVLAQQAQLDLANHLMSAGRHGEAAVAYERFLDVYAAYAQREQVQLILALIYARYLDRRQRARELLTAALPRLGDAEQRTLAQETLAEIG